MKKKKFFFIFSFWKIIEFFIHFSFYLKAVTKITTIFWLIKFSIFPFCGLPVFSCFFSFFTKRENLIFTVTFFFSLPLTFMSEKKVSVRYCSKVTSFGNRYRLPGRRKGWREEHLQRVHLYVLDVPKLLVLLLQESGTYQSSKLLMRSQFLVVDNGRLVKGGLLRILGLR